MYGALYVVADLDAYQANPEAYLASNKIEPVDALLKDRRPRTEWKLEDLATAVTALPQTGDDETGPRAKKRSRLAVALPVTGSMASAPSSGRT